MLLIGFNTHETSEIDHQPRIYNGPYVRTFQLPGIICEENWKKKAWQILPSTGIRRLVGESR